MSKRGVRDGGEGLWVRDAAWIPSLVLIMALLPAVASGQWEQLGSDIDGAFAEDWFGWSVSVSSSGSLMAIGAPGTDGDGSSPGYARVYQWLSLTSSWEQVGLNLDGDAAGGWSGYSVSLSSSGSSVAIGAPVSQANGSYSGQVRVYEWISPGWVQKGPDLNGESANDLSGYSVSLSSDGSRVAIGAHKNDGNGSNSGHVRVYQWLSLTSSWQQVGPDIDGENSGDWSGYSVSLSSNGSRVAIGAPYNDANGGESGQVRVFEWISPNWVQKGPDIDGEFADDWSGWSVSLSSFGTRVAVGAPGNDDYGANSGQVRVYQWLPLSSSWVQVGSNIPGEGAGDRAGSSVSLSADGFRVAIGAPRNDDNGSLSGHVELYEWGTAMSDWVQVGSDIDGEAEGDESGFAVALSDDGTHVVIGAPGNDDNGEGSGQVRVFRYPIFADGFESGNTIFWSG